MRICPGFVCDKCGAVISDSANNRNALSCFLQGPYKNFGVRHLCYPCVILFEKHFTEFFDQRNQ